MVSNFTFKLISLTPTAAYADIVLPIASAWEREGLRVGFALDQSACECVQLRPAIVVENTSKTRTDRSVVSPGGLDGCLPQRLVDYTVRPDLSVTIGVVVCAEKM